jgi:hypothetical protein
VQDRLGEVVVDFSNLSDLAASVTTAVGPFLAHLITYAKDKVAPIEKLVADHGHDAWALAQRVWAVVAPLVKPESELDAAAKRLALKPSERGRASEFSSELMIALASDSSLAKMLAQILEEPASQTVLATKHSVIRDVVLDMEGGGTQLAHADDHSRIEVAQIKK